MKQLGYETDISEETDAIKGRPDTSNCSGIQSCWQRGLDILKPSTTQVEHGLELHANTLSIDTFGFLPMVINKRVKQEWNGLVEAGVTGNEFRFRSEMCRRVAPTYDETSGRQFLEALHCSGLSGMMHTAAEGKSTEEDVKRIATSVHTCGCFGDRVRQFRSVEDVRQSHRLGRFAVGLSVNGPPCTARLTDIDDELRWLDAWYQLGVRMMHLTYNRRNVIGTGCAERNDGGLSELGYDFVRALNRVGIIVDVAHSSDNTAIDVATVTERPVVASHTGCKGVFEHIRNKGDKALKDIAHTDGLVGIVTLPRFLGPDGTIQALLDHIDYASQLVGVDHVAIGSDNCYSQSFPSDIKQSPDSKFSSRWWGAWHRAVEHKAVKESQEHHTGSLAWTNWPLFTVGLVMRGYSDNDIQKILGGNLLRVMEANEPTGYLSVPASPDMSEVDR